MLAVVQRVLQASVRVEASRHEASIGCGLLVLLGVVEGDAQADANWMIRKLANLRIFRDDDGRMNRSVQDIGGEVLVISQFTLAGDCRRGNRPSFAGAADPAAAQRMYEDVVDRLAREASLPVARGEFGADMEVSLVNDGPVTILLDSRA